MARRKRTPRALAWPDWWPWEIEITPHAEKRMEDRGFNELDLRTMLHEADALTPGQDEGRWIVEARRDDATWKIIVEPDHDKHVIVVVTAFRRED